MLTTMTPAASDALEWLSSAYVVDFPGLAERSFKLPPEHAGSTNELVALRFVTPAPRGFVWLTTAAQTRIMSHRPDLVDENKWSDEADNLRDELAGNYQAAGYPPRESWSFSSGGRARTFNELRALGYVERVTLSGDNWRLSQRGQSWIMRSLDE